MRKPERGQKLSFCDAIASVNKKTEGLSKAQQPARTLGGLLYRNENAVSVIDRGNRLSKTDPRGATHLTIIVQREKFAVKNQDPKIDDEAEFVFHCHNECIPPTIEINLERFRNPID